ncbi:putative lipase ROG1 [Sesamum alatum]|uniref:Lipase ROG1 n=1 Tax=Sesamum alatum TaxID=300844 RepID=A0AAE2CZR3_9LAMI|nr:putative lipase ROG1 [Sesamum alatum]
MASYPSLFCCGCPRRRNSNSINHNNHTPSSSTSCFSSPSNSSYHRAPHNWNFLNFSGVKSIWKRKSLKAEAMSKTQGNLSSPRIIINVEDKPEHLLVLVHGILGSPSDWTYFEAELKRRLGKKFLIHASSCNTYTKTFTGIDGAGKRLADEVMHIVKKTEGLKKISFLAHSLGGLIARYAIAVLYTSKVSYEQTDGTAVSPATNFKPYSSNDGLIAGLEAINFITLATPHLGVRGNKQLPFLLGVPFLEKLAAPMAPIFTGQTGSQLFLTDGNPDKPPLLLRMATDCDDGKFISALGTFQRRVLYANVSYDHMVGWRTSSIRRESELVEPPSQSLDGYKHIVNVEYSPPVLSESPHFLPEAAKAKVAAQNEPNTQNTIEYHEIMEEEMIRGLQRLGWIKVDVSFRSAFWPFFAHYNIHVKNEWLHNAGAGVVAHVADTIKQQDSAPPIGASFFCRSSLTV